MCEIEKHCAFFVVAEGFSHAIEAVQRTLCKDDYQSCARYVVHKSLGTGAVPDNLLPTDHIAAERLTGQSDSVSS